MSKKHKVKIPEGYKVDKVQRLNFPDKTIDITLSLKPIKKELPKTWEEYLGKAKGIHLIGALEVK